MKLFESWAAGVPFVSGDVGDRGLLLGTPPAGVLAWPGSVAALAEGILQVLNDAAYAEELRQRGRRRVVEFYWDTLVRRLDASYRKEPC